jgi:hypothetical protein
MMIPILSLPLFSYSSLLEARKDRKRKKYEDEWNLGSFEGKWLGA